MNNSRLSVIFVLLANILASCAPQAAAIEVTPTQVEPTQTSIPPTATLTFTPLPTETTLPSDTPTPTLPSCAVALNPTDNATVPARGPFDFTWTAFAGAASYIVAIGPAGWYPTNFPVNGTTLTRYMENFPSSASYEWTISAVNAAGQELCKAGPYKFVMSPDLAATPSFSISNVILPTTESGNDSSEASSGKHKNGSGQGSSGDTSLDESIIILADSDSEDCRLFVIYKVKINHPFTSFQLIYGFSPGTVDGAVDLTANSSEPYPAYNQYNALTPPLPVKNGDTVYFGTSYTLDIGASSRGLTLLHAMTHCKQ